MDQSMLRDQAQDSATGEPPSRWQIRPI